jgi:hypothetical protein
MGRATVILCVLWTSESLGSSGLSWFNVCLWSKERVLCCIFVLSQININNIIKVVCGVCGARVLVSTGTYLVCVEHVSW